MDLNCDMGESYGVYDYGMDREMMPLISSANIACGFHAGDPRIMHETVELAQTFGVRIGAHIGLPDRLGFGRRYMQLSPGEMYDYTLYQIGALNAFLRYKGIALTHVKLYGALYMMACEQRDLAEAYVRAVRSWDPALEIYTLPGSEVAASAAEHDLTVVTEYFADRPYSGQDVKMFGWTYEEIGTPENIGDRVENMLNDPAFAGIGTICVHSDTRNAPAIMKRIKDRLQLLGYSTKKP